MQDALSKLFSDFDRGVVSRRQLFHVLGVAAVGVALPVRVFGQGRCGGERANLPGCDKTPAKLPFDPTGWKTVSIDHFTMQAADYKREAAYYAALMNWKIRSDDGNQAVLDIGDDVGSVIIRGGYQAPPAPPIDSAAAAARLPQVGTRWGAAAAECRFGILLLGHRAVGREERRSGIAKARTRSDRRQRRQGFESFHVKDPDGFDAADQQRQPARIGDREPRAEASPAAAPFEPDELEDGVAGSHLVSSVRLQRERRVLSALLGWKPDGDEGSQNECEIGDVGDIIIRGGGAGGRGGGAGATGARGDSVGGRGGAAPCVAWRRSITSRSAFTPWDADQVKAELDKRGLIREGRHGRVARTSMSRRTRAITRRRRTGSTCRSATARARVGTSDSLCVRWRASRARGLGCAKSEPNYQRTRHCARARDSCARSRTRVMRSSRE